MKLLSPVQNIQGLNAAIYNGADEVYLGINEFNARNNTQGFTLETLKDAVVKAHIFGVKVNLAINILFSDDELQSALNTLICAYNLGVDAFIVQDLGLAKIVFENYPDIVLHASTQMGIHNLEGVRFLEKYGFKRVVLARETPLSEIKRIRDNSDIEIEYFAHGALCVSFSGNCYLSSALLGASGNRGRCKQLCRLPYSLLSGDKTVKKGYLLSAKDFCTIDKLNELKDAGVSVLKIEGRARRNYYVAKITNAYRRAIDGLSYNQKEIDLAFNRGYTFGYFENKSIINSKNQNHIGISLGKIVKINGGKKFNEVFFNAKTDVSKGSTIKVFDSLEREKTTLSAFDINKVSDNMYRLTTTQSLAVGDSLRLIADGEEERLAELFMPKKSVDIELEVIENKEIVAYISTPFGRKKILGEVAQKSINSPLQKEQFLECFNKSDLFTPNISFLRFENVFLQKSKLNQFRRNVYEKLVNSYFDFYRKNKSPQTLKIASKNLDFYEYEIVDKIKDNYTKKFVIYSPESYSEVEVEMFINSCKNCGKTPLLDLPNFALENDIILLKKIIEKTGIKTVANNYYAFSIANIAVIGAGLNCYNSYTASIFNLPFISAESGKWDFPLMTFRHCPVKEHLSGNCDKCLYKGGLKLKAENGKVFEIKRKKLATCTFYLTD